MKKEIPLPEIIEFEKTFFKVLDDLKDYLGDLTLVGGWLPFVYSHFLWQKPAVQQTMTVDIDFGFNQRIKGKYPKTIFERLSGLDYKERHYEMDRMYPVVLYKNKMPVEFITFPSIKKEVSDRFIGNQIFINKIEKFDFLLQNQIQIGVTDKNNKPYRLNCPKPSAFLYHKGVTFHDRENPLKKAKDLHYMYFILRHAPDLDVILGEVIQYRKLGIFPEVKKHLDTYFEKKSSDGCLMVEKEIGHDEYIENIRQDVFERFKILRDTLKKVR